MTSTDLTLEIFTDGVWQPAAELGLTPAGTAAGQHPCQLSYTIDYALPRQGDNRVVDRLSCRYPVNFSRYDDEQWPPFLYDLLPSGPARQAWLKRLNLAADDDSALTTLLTHASRFAVGNLRIAAPASTVTTQDFNQRGFTPQEIVAHHDDFAEYAAQCGADVAGAFDVQGKHPKLLLVLDHDGNWHAEGAIADERVRSHWLVKFPRRQHPADQQILANEATYYEAARAFGLNTAPYPLFYDDGALFIQRFDRQVTANGMQRFGMESLASLCGLTSSAATLSHNQACAAIQRYTTNPQQEIFDYISRDILNTVLRNTDNHPRNTALLKHPNGTVALSPLFDFGPSFLDPGGLNRAMRWDGDGEQMLGLPVWGRIACDLEQQLGLPARQLRQWLAALSKNTERLPDTLHQCQVDSAIIDKLIGRIKGTTRMLRDAQPHS